MFCKQATAIAVSCFAISLTLHVGDAGAASDSATLAQQIKLALKGKDAATLREAGKKLGEALSATTGAKDTEALAKLSPPLLRALLDAASTAEARQLAEAAHNAREKFAKRKDALAGDLINAMGEADFEAGDAKKALAEFEASLQMREKAFGSNHPLVAESLNNIAVVQQSLGEFKLARGNFERSLKVREKTLPKNHKDIAESLNNLARLNRVTGHYAKAEDQFKASLALRKVNPGPDSLDYASSLNNLAGLYSELGLASKALPLHSQALNIRRSRLGAQHAQVSESLNNLALAHALLGDDATAEIEYRQAIEISAAALGKKHPTVATLKNNLGLLLLRAGRLEDAHQFLGDALAMRQELLGDSHPRTGRSLDNLAKVYLARKDVSSARTLLSEALLIVEGGTDPDSKWRVLDTARRMEEARGNVSAAIVFGKRAVNILQKLRVEIRSLDKQLQQSFVKDKGDVYRSLFELLVTEGRLAEAQQVLVMMKEDEYFDFVQRGGKADPRTSQVSFASGEKAGMAQYDRVSANIGAMIAERSRLRKKANPDAVDTMRLTELDAQIRNAKIAFDAVLGEIYQHFASKSAERALEIGRMNLAELKSIQGTLEQMGEGTVTLHYILLEDKVRILLTTPQLQVARESNVSQRNLNRLIQRFRHALQHPSRDAQIGAVQLYQLLVAPIARDLEQADAKTMMLSLDGALRYLPFAALNDGERYLIEKYRIATFAEAARDKLKDKPVDEWQAAGLGMTQAVDGFSPLPGVANELRSIVKTSPVAGGVIPGQIQIDSAFSRKSILAALEKGYPVLHIASHFIFQPGAELESFLLLGDKSRLSLKEIKDEDFDFRQIELIALSACETAIGGGADSFGREIEGLAALVQKQGARSVMATLWEVSDESTAQLMALFYANRSIGRFSKAEALRQAQLSFLRGEVADDSATSAHQRAAVASAMKVSAEVKARGYSHPYFWAPFVLTGNWL